jgi:hypothetical protein
MMSTVRTTLTLDDDVADKLKELARRKRIPFRAAVNETLRRGLSSPRARGLRSEPFKAATFDSAFRPGVDALKLNQLVDELEARQAADTRRR